MRERPPLPDSALVAALADGWGVVAAAVEFLPVGDDSNAWSYRVAAADGRRRHLKVRRDRSTRPRSWSRWPCATTAWSRWWPPCRLKTATRGGRWATSR